MYMICTRASAAICHWSWPAVFSKSTTRGRLKNFDTLCAAPAANASEVMERQCAPANSPTLQEKAVQLREVFGVTVTEAENVLNMCEGDLDQATALLSSHTNAAGSGYIAQETGEGEGEGGGGGGGGGMETGDQTTPTRTAADGGSADPATGSMNNPIDLTREEDDLQKALALSIQDMHSSNPHTSTHTLSLEEQELSRALEASLAESQIVMARMGMPLQSLFVDPLNPHERKRKGFTPVGLKNIGNTCWFSAVIQSLFHIPAFCEVILAFQPPPLPNGIAEYPQCVRFVLELQKLFALLIGSQRQYINPQTAILLLKEAFAKAQTSAGAQQDISEFTHKLLEWIEDAFTSLESDRENPVIQLFTGRCITEGVNGGQPFINKSDFGAFPVQVQGHAHLHDLHDCLDAATCNPEMQQETWFTHLPPILVLELSRFKYNQHSGRAEKIHDPLHFDRELFMDRYMEVSKIETRKRREEVSKLRTKLRELETRLRRFAFIHTAHNYVRYQNEPMSISSILNLVLAYVHSHNKTGEGEGGEGEEEGEQRSGKRARTSLHPVPRFVSSEEQSMFESCLTRWRVEMEQDMADLGESIRATKTSLDAVYSDPPMKATCYHLHAVLVHQGQASGGHYWAYVKRPPRLPGDNGEDRAKSPVSVGDRNSEDVSAWSEETGQPVDVTIESQSEGEEEEEEVAGGSDSTYSKSSRSNLIQSRLSSERTLATTECVATGTVGGEGVQDISTGAVQGEGMEVGGGDGDIWLKFNDVSVCEVGWEEVRRESLGGKQNTSAYCLVYINSTLHQQSLEQVVQPLLGGDLLQLVESDNTAFSDEIADYDTKQQQQNPPPAKPTKCVQWEDQEGSAKASEGDGDGTARSSDAKAVGPKYDTTTEHMQVDSPPLPPVSSQLYTEVQQQLAYQRQQLGRQLGASLVEPRVCHIGSYAIRSGASEELVKAVVLQEVSNEAERRERPDIRILAKKDIVFLLSHEGVQAKLNTLRTMYQYFCTACYHATQAAQFLAADKWDSALVHAAFAYRINCRVAKESGSERFALDTRILGSLRRHALMGVSHVSYRVFESGEVQKALSLANTLLVPGLRSLSELPCDGDEVTVETVREEWCQCLVNPDLSDAEQDSLADLLTSMLEDRSKGVSLVEPHTPANVDTERLAMDYSSAVHLFQQQIQGK